MWQSLESLGQDFGSDSSRNVMRVLHATRDPSDKCASPLSIARRVQGHPENARP